MCVIDYLSYLHDIIICERVCVLFVGYTMLSSVTVTYNK